MNIGILNTVSFGSWDMVKDAIDNAVNSINAMGQGILSIMQDETILNKIKEIINDTNLADAIKSIALTLVTVFFLIDFLHKSLDLKWVTWENVMMLFLKLVIAKVCVENADFLMSCIYNGFNSLITSIDPSINIIPTSDPAETYGYFLCDGDAQKLINRPGIGWLDFTPVGLWLLATIQGFIMMGIMAVTLVIVLSRFIELAVFIFAAPIPLATLGCDGLQDVGKSYLKSFAACSIHAMVILMVFIAYGALSSALSQSAYTNMFGLGGFMGLIKTFILGGAIMKSEQWAKRICGAM